MKLKESWPVQSECASIVSSSTPIDKADCTKIHDFIDESKRNLANSVRKSLNNVILHTYWELNSVRKSLNSVILHTYWEILM